MTGPARSGKSTTLLAVAGRVPGGRPRPHGRGRGRAPLARSAATRSSTSRWRPGEIGDRLVAAVDAAAGRVLVLVDDAEAIDDVGGVLERLSTSDRPDLLFVAAGRNDGIRSGYSHWTRPLRRSKVGVLLRPDVDLDGDILGVIAAPPGAGGDGRRAAATSRPGARPSWCRWRCR